MKLISSFIFLVVSVLVQAQIPVGNWRMHLPCSNAIHVAYSPSRVYCTTGESLFSYNPNDNSIEKHSKITGLSDFGISAISYSPEPDILVIGYTNGNIDLVKGKSITNISDLKRKSLPANKVINHIFFDGKFAYLSCGFGIILLDLEKSEIKDTYIFGLNGSYIYVNGCTVFNDEIFAATASGIYKASKNDPMLVDYARWSRVTTVPNNDKAFLQITQNDNVLYAVYSNPDAGKDSVYYFKDNVWNALPLDENTDVYNVSFSSDKIFVSTAGALLIYDKSFRLRETVKEYKDIAKAAPRECYMDNNDNLWIADFGSGLIEKGANGRIRQFLPNGPVTSRVKSFYFSNNNLYTTAGGVDVTSTNLYNPAEFSVFANDQWRGYSNPGVSDYMGVKTDPMDKDMVYISSWGWGIFGYRNGEVVSHYDETNSTLQNAIPGGPYTRVWGMDFDKDGNLWVSNSNVTNSLSMMKRTGEWIGFPLKSIVNAEVVSDVVVDDFNNIWAVLLKGGGIMVLNTNNTPDNRDDDKLVKFKPKNAYGQTVNNVYTITKDLDGNIWTGTDFGPVVYSHPDEVFEGNVDGRQPTLPHPGTDVVDPLLGSEIVRAIAIDGANRKWIGTERGGAFLVSADGDSSLLQFNVDNSPILSNTIVGIGIHDKTGEVFFGTDRGIISYRSDATKADEDFGDVYAFPNPVRPNYDGVITITGLIKDANVKITDIAGNLVYETTTLGGQVVWDGNNLDGRRVATGIYIIFCANSDGSKTYVTKLLFMK